MPKAYLIKDDGYSVHLLPKKYDLCGEVEVEVSVAELRYWHQVIKEYEKVLDRMDSLYKRYKNGTK